MPEHQHHPRQRRPRGAADRRRPGARRDDQRRSGTGRARPVAWVGLRGIDCAASTCRSQSEAGRRDDHGDGLVLTSLLVSARVSRWRRPPGTLRGRDPSGFAQPRCSPWFRRSAALFVLAGRPRKDVQALPASPGVVLAITSLSSGRNAVSVHAVRLRAGPAGARGRRAFLSPGAARRGRWRATSSSATQPARSSSPAAPSSSSLASPWSSLPLLGTGRTARPRSSPPRRSEP